MRAVERASIAFAVSICLAGAALAQTKAVPEPAGLWNGPMHSATPATLRGVTVLDVRRTADLIAAEHPVMIDVSHADKRPPGLAKDALWSPVHRSLPGATWLPGAGMGIGDPQYADLFARTANDLTGGDKAKPILTFCHPNRWGSWNAAKRLTALGYTHVYWFPGGAEGWVEGGNRLAEAKPAQGSDRFDDIVARAAPAQTE